MVAAITAPGAVKHGSTSISITGHSNTTAYDAVITWASGRTQVIKFTTDGSGAATLTAVPGGDDVGTYTVATRPSVTAPVTTVSASGKVV